MRSLRVLVVAGRDSTGGAGLDADHEALTAFGVEPLLVCSADTQQGPGGLLELGARPVSAWWPEAREHLDAGVQAIKFGLLPGSDAIEAAAELCEAAPGVPVILDPVLGPSAGGEFLDAAGRAALVELLPRLRAHLTPNLPEAAALLGLAAIPESREEREAAARELLDHGAAAVLLKGGHGGEDPLRDLWVSRADGALWIERRREPGPGIRGSGCRLASAFAAGLARGRNPVQAAKEAGDWVAQRIRQARVESAGERTESVGGLASGSPGAIIRDPNTEAAVAQW